ncbi:MAG TPA: hypothetical protein VNO30_35015 [Kofleriaceae bacterium]|nr:hypothetical protein [Kofleriaceae bacterium]
MRATKRCRTSARPRRAAAAAVDAHFFAHKRVVVETSPTFAPTIGYSRSGFSLGVGGSF